MRLGKKWAILAIAFFPITAAFILYAVVYALITTPIEYFEEKRNKKSNQTP